jgi:hypothetical protein
MLPEIEEGVYTLRFVYVDGEEETQLHYYDVLVSNRIELDRATKTTTEWLRGKGNTVLKISAKRKEM